MLIEIPFFIIKIIKIIFWILIST